MSHNRRLIVPGGTYFFTARLKDQGGDLLVTHIDTLRLATKLALKRWPFRIDAAVVLPNTLHMIWTLPESDPDYAKRWRLIKTSFSRHAPPAEGVSPSHKRPGGKGVWQRRLWAHLIRDDDDMDRHLHVIRSAPLHAGLAKGPCDWPYSSFSKSGAPNVRTTAPAPSSPDPVTAAVPMRKMLIVGSGSYG